MYRIKVKYPLLQISVPKLPLLTFDQRFMPLFHQNHKYILTRWIFNQYSFLILLLHVLLTVIFVILLLLNVIAALPTCLNITCYNSWQEANLDMISYN